MKHYLKLYKSKNFEELKLNLKNSIKNIKKEHNENYFTYAYNKYSYKSKENSKKSSKHRIKFIKIKNRHLKYAPL